MTDIVNNEAAKPLTVGAFIESLSTFPQDIEIVAGIEDVGMTISLVGAMVLSSSEGIDLAVLQLHKDNTIRALDHMMQNIKVD